MALPTKEERIRRKKVMLAAGINVPNTDESWGPWWDELWEKAITHTKTNDYYGVPSVWNLARRTFDNITGNTTYKAEPLPIGGTILATDESVGALIKRTVNNWLHSGDPVRDITMLLMPDLSKPIKVGKTIIKATPLLVKKVPKAVTATKKLLTGEVSKEAVKEGIKTAGAKTVKFVAKEVPKFIVGYEAGKGVDKASNAFTGKSWAENITDKMSNMAGFHIEPIFGELTNPGYYVGGPVVNSAMNGAEYAIMNLNYYIPLLTNNKTLRKGFGLILNKFGLGTGYLNIRYRNGIRDYLGNVISKYSTVAPKPVVFSGNLLELARQRVLNNLEKYGIRDSDYVSWTTSIDDPSLILLSKSAGFEIPSYNKPSLYAAPLLVTVTMPARTYLEHINPIPGEEAAFMPYRATIFHQNSGYIEDIQRLYPEFVDAHEFSHAIDWVLNNKTHTLPRTSGVDIRLDTSSIKDIYKQFISKPKIDLSKVSDKVDVKVPGLNYNRIKLDIVTLEYHHSPTELKARYELIRNWLGITDERPLTLTEWNLAKRYYTSSVGDNDMLEFFKLVENPEEFINWASKRYSTNSTGTVSRINITELPKGTELNYMGSNYPYKVSHEDELPGFLDMILELAGGKAPISLTTGLTSYAMLKPSQLLTPSERPFIFNGIRTTLRRLNPETITAGDLAYGLAHNLREGWDRRVYRGILKDTGKVNFDYEEAARALMYDVKGQLYKKLAAQKNGPLTAEEFEDALWDLTKADFLNAFKKAHGGMYRRDIPLTFNIENLDVLNDIPRIIEILTKYKNGGKFYKKGTQFNK